MGIGKIIYDKGRRDEARNISDKIDIAYAGIEIGRPTVEDIYGVQE